MKTEQENVQHPTPVTIEQVENGYLLTSSFDTEARYPRRDSGPYEVRQPRVFPSKAALVSYLAEHFTHEMATAPMDSPAGSVIPTPAPSLLQKFNFGRRDSDFEAVFGRVHKA